MEGAIVPPLRHFYVKMTYTGKRAPRDKKTEGNGTPAGDVQYTALLLNDCPFRYIRGVVVAFSDRLIRRYFEMLRQLSSRKFTKNYVRAYICALADIYAVEIGAREFAGYQAAVQRALDHASKAHLRDYNSVMEQWRALDRSELKRPRGGPLAQEPVLEKRESTGLSVVSLFTGSYGLDLGFEYAGYDVTVGLDIDPASEEILRLNRPDVPFILDDVANVSSEEILKEAGLSRGEVDVITGGPPCQPFSTAGKREGLNDPRASPLVEFIRIVKDLQPRAFVMEEVTGLLNARLRHVPIRERNRPLKEEEQPGSVWRVVLQMLESTGYRIKWRVLNAADFGAPQVRNRVIVVGVRPDVGRPVLPDQTHIRPDLTGLGTYARWRVLGDVMFGSDDGDYSPLPPSYQEIAALVPPGGNWRQLPVDLQKEALKGAYNSGGGKTGFYRRLCWLEPAPTLVTSPAMKATMMVHPFEDRPLSVEEYKVIQGFPVSWELPRSSRSARYRKVGEAVPVYLSYAVAEALKEVLLGGRPT